MKANLFKYLQGSAEGGWRLNRKVITFVFCLAISSFFWLAIVLSRQYLSIINIPCSYINLPTDKVVSGELPQNIGVKVKASGFRILFFKLFKKIEQVTVDTKEIKPLKKIFYLTTASKIDNVSRQLSSEFEIVKIIPDTLFFNFDKKVDKIVPVKLNLEIDYEKQFDLNDSIRVSPNAVQLSGAAEAIDKIDYVETEKLVIHQAKEAISQKLKIVPPPQGVVLSISSVNITIPVVQFTEGSIELPLEVQNLPNAYSIKTFPEQITLRYMVAYENYSKINQKMFKVAGDYSKIEKGSDRLKVEVKNFPSQYISEKTIKIHPEKVEYIIRKK